VSAEQLAGVTAEQAFVDADLNHDGRLSFEEFQSWYSSANESGDQTRESESASLDLSDESDDDSVEDGASSSVDSITLSEVRRVTCLPLLGVEEVFEQFAVAADEDGLLDEASFFNCFKQIKLQNGGIDEQDYGVFNSIVLRLFEIFDTDGNNAVDFSELASGLSVLCGGSRDEKAKAAFALYDYDNDGFISLEEMMRYLTSVFKVMYETQPGTKERMGCSAEELAEVTTRQAFEDADLNHDGRLSFEEFRGWYSDSNDDVVVNETPAAKVEPEIRPTLQEVRDLLGLGSYSVEEVFASFADASNADGLLDQEAFSGVVQEFAFSELVDGADSSLKIERVLSIAQTLFGIFVDSQGKIDFCDLASGLSILCGGSAGNRIAAAFSLYDYNGDGFISLPEMTRFLKCVFKVLFEVENGRVLKARFTPEELAGITAEQAFHMADTNHDGRLSFEEFKSWYASEAGQAINQRGKSSSAMSAMSQQQASGGGGAITSLSEARRFTGLGNRTVQQVFEVLADTADEEGMVQLDRFLDSFSTLDGPDGLMELLVDIFSLFDTSMTGRADFAELASGISVLCGGSSDEKVGSAFALFDFNGDGFISLTEFTTYLSAVYKVMYETTPGTQKRIGATPEELAKITAEEAFIEAGLELNDRLSFSEFKTWFASAGLSSDGADEPMEEDAAVEDANDENNLGTTLKWDVSSVQEATKIDRFSPSDLFEVFSEASVTQEDGSHALSHEAFMQCAYNIVTLGGGYGSEEAAELCDEFFSLVADRFSNDVTGMIDPRSVASGLSVLCTGPRDAKVRAAFDLFDINGDGFISKQEMLKYLSAVFKVLYVATPGMQKQLVVSADDLGEVTTAQVFQQCDTNNDGRLSFKEFKQWYTDAGPL